MTLLVVPVIFLALLSGTQILLLSQENSQDSSDALRADSIANLERIASDEALFIDETFKQYESEIKMLDRYTESLFNGEVNITPGHSYYWDSALEFAETGYNVPGLAYDSDYESYISFDVSCYYLPKEHMRGNDPFDLSSQMQEILNSASNMDNMFRSLHKANRNYVWLYAGFEGDGHLFKNYPYDSMSWCIDFYETTGFDYDPHAEEWYTNAASLDDDSTAFTSPYWDPAGLLMSIGRPSHFSNGSLIGVVSADITIDVINDAILGVEVLDNGYAFMIDSQGNVISHPEADPEAEEVPTLGELEFGQSVTEKTSFESNILPKMISGQIVTEPYAKMGKTWYISYIPINTTGYSLGIVVPEQDIIASAIAIRNTINNLAIQQTMVFILALSVVIIGVVVAGSYMSNKIVQPVKELTSMVNFIAEGDLSRDLRGNPRSMGKEVATLHSAFDNLLTSLRFGNTDYYRGDLKRAYQNYQKALTLFTTTKNERGIAIAKNNLGNIYRAWNDFNRAREHYQEAIDIGEKQGDKKGLASRLNNLGLLYLDREAYQMSLQLLERAKAYDEEINNTKGLITRIGNLGIIHERLGDFDKAEREYKEAIHLAEKNNETRGLAHSYLKYAIFHIVQAKHEEGLKLLQKSFDLAKSVDDVNIALKCLDRMASTYDELDRSTESHRAKVSAANIRKKLIMPKMALFVLDYSGSMDGSKIRSVVKGTRKLFQDQINPQDKVGLVIFSSESKTLLPLGDVRNRESTILKTISSLKYPDGMTAFYDALGDALIFLNNEKGNEQKWLIALTDGEDNKSHRFSLERKRRSSLIPDIFTRIMAQSIPDFIDENLLTINIVIVGVGSEVKALAPKLRELCDMTPRGRYIDVSDPSISISTAIDNAFKEIREVMGEVDVEGFDVLDV